MLGINITWHIIYPKQVLLYRLGEIQLQTVEYGEKVIKTAWKYRCSRQGM